MRAVHNLRGLAAVLVFAGAFVLFSGSAPALAEDEFNVYAHMESFVWKEFDGTTQLLKESGPLYGVGFTFHGDIGGEGASLTLTPRIEIFGGEVDYDGQACDGFGNCFPSMSDTGYLGLKLEFDIGGRFGSGINIEPFAGIGIREWWRDIQDTTAYNPVSGFLEPVSGYTENWNMFYGRLGIRGDIGSKESKMFFEAVARIPIYNENTAYLSDISFLYEDVTMEPGKVVTLFAELGFKLHAFKMSAFYEALRFSESKHVITYDPFSGFFMESWQPKSEADIFGVRIGAAF